MLPRNSLWVAQVACAQLLPLQGASPSCFQIPRIQLIILPMKITNIKCVFWVKEKWEEWLLYCSPSFIRIGSTAELGEAFKHFLIEVKAVEVCKFIKVTFGHPGWILPFVNAYVGCSSGCCRALVVGDGLFFRSEINEQILWVSSYQEEAVHKWLGFWLDSACCVDVI